MYVVDKQGAQWSIDEGLRDRAYRLFESFQNEIGHVDIEQVIFLRITGSKANWHGKCYYIGRAPMSIIPKFLVNKLKTMNLLNMGGVSSLDLDIFDLRYIIVINDDSIRNADGDLQRVEDIVILHELMHIHPDGDKLVKHDIEDFKSLVDKFGAHWTEGVFKDNEEVPDLVSGTSENWTPEESD